MRLYRAICAWLEVQVALLASPREDYEEPYRESAVDSQVGHSGQSDYNHELNNNDRPGAYGYMSTKKVGF